MIKSTRKLYYSIREVSDLTGVPSHILRYWEQEFRCLKPKRSSSKVRKYREKDLQIIQIVKDLLYVQKFTIAGAKKKLNELGFPEFRKQKSEPLSIKSKPEVKIPIQKEGTFLDKKKEIIEAIKEDLKQLLQLL